MKAIRSLTLFSMTAALLLAGCGSDSGGGRGSGGGSEGEGEGEEGEGEEGEGEEGEGEEGEGEEGEGEEGEGEGEEGEGEEGEGEEGEGEGEDPVGACEEGGYLDFEKDAEDLGDGVSIVRGTNDGTNDFEGSCGGDGGNDVAVKFVAPEAGTWAFTTRGEDTDFDTLMYVRTTCDDTETEIDCNDDTRGLQSFVEAELAEGDEVFIIVDAFSDAAVGAWSVSIFLVDFLDAEEACDLEELRDRCPEDTICYDESLEDFELEPAEAGTCAAIEEVEFDGACRDSILVNCVEGSYCYFPEPEEGEDDEEDPEEPEEEPEGTCLEITPPAIVDGTAYSNEDRLALIVNGTDTSRDTIGFKIELLDAEGEALVLNPDNDFEACPELDQDGCFEEFGACTWNFEEETCDPNIITENDIGLAEPVTGLAEFTARVLIVGLSEFPDAESIRVWLRDSRDGESEPVVLAFEDQPTVEDNAECDAFGIVNACAGEESECMVPIPEDDEEPAEVGECRVPATPTIDEASFYYNDDAQSIAVEIEGTDADGDVTGWGFRFFDEDGEELDLFWPPLPEDDENCDEEDECDSGWICFEDDDDEEGECFETWRDLTFADVERDGAAFIGTDGRTLPDDTEIATALVTVLDARGLRSEPIELDPIAPVEVAVGEECDRLSARNVCAEGSICVEDELPEDAPEDAEPEEPVCEEPVAECPEDFGEVTNLLDFADGGATIEVEGDTTGAESVTVGSCGGGSGQDIYSFEAPSEGTYIFTTEGADGDDTLLYIREFCGYDGLAGELACNDDIDTQGGNYFSRIEVELGFRQTVYIFVDGYNGGGIGWQGGYTLTVSIPEE